MAKTINPKMVRLMKDVVLFADLASGIKLREYQVGAAVRIVDSILKGRGRSFVVMFPRQSGKNELQAQVEAYLLALLCQEDAEIVKVSPTWKPQSLNAMRRLERILERNLVTRGQWQKESGYIYRVGRARIFFLSGSPEANIVGATASTLLEVDEAQDGEGKAGSQHQRQLGALREQVEPGERRSPHAIPGGGEAQGAEAVLDHVPPGCDVRQQ